MFRHLCQHESCQDKAIAQLWWLAPVLGFDEFKRACWQARRGDVRCQETMALSWEEV